MLKWLSGTRPKSPPAAEVVTDDPLATIHVPSASKLAGGPLEIYAVSRVNPIFDEGGEGAEAVGGGSSSGYGSGGGSGSGSGARSPSGSLSGSPKQSSPPTPEQPSKQPPLPPDPPPLSTAPPPPRLSTIPEGRVVAVPRPVWPHQSQLDALYVALTGHPPPPSDAASSSSTASSGFGDDHAPSLPARLVRGCSSREKLLADCRSSPGSAPAGTHRKLARTPATCWVGVVPGDVCLQSKDDFLWRPDFTLDRPAAERLVRNIQKAKRRRCWCRLVTSLLGLIFFLLSVMAVSLAMTRGRRYFGPL